MERTAANGGEDGGLAMERTATWRWRGRQPTVVGEAPWCRAWRGRQRRRHAGPGRGEVCRGGASRRQGGAYLARVRVSGLVASFYTPLCLDFPGKVDGMRYGAGALRTGETHFLYETSYYVCLVNHTPLFFCRNYTTVSCHQLEFKSHPLFKLLLVSPVTFHCIAS
jgi:hypothetical protein